MPTSPHFRSQLPSLDFLDAFGFKTNVKTIREGDWICLYCQNLNFSFRNECNRCKAFADSTVREPSEVLNSNRDIGFMDYRCYFNMAMMSHQMNLSLNDQRRNELFEKVCGRDDGFSNVVFISFELNDNSGDSSDEGEDLKHFETTRILSLLDE